MNILVISDTHGSIDVAMKYIDKNYKRINKIIHLGDYSRDARKLEILAGKETHFVRGNGDIEDKTAQDEKVLEMFGKRILLTHGHKYSIKMDLGNLFYRAQEAQVDAVLFGHTHIPVSIIYQDILLFNPGSPTAPRGGNKPTLGMIEINGRYMRGEIIDASDMLQALKP